MEPPRSDSYDLFGGSHDFSSFFTIEEVAPPSEAVEAPPREPVPAPLMTNERPSAEQSDARLLQWMRHVVYILNDTPAPALDAVLSYFILQNRGRRFMQKNTVNVNQLSESEQRVFAHIQSQLRNPERKRRVTEFLNDRKITRRLINFFVVHYTKFHPVAYYLDKRQYPYTIVKPMNQPALPQVLELIGQGAPIRWINLYAEYMSCKKLDLYRNCHAAYGRSNAVKDDVNTATYTLCEMNFFLWLDSVGGIDAFRELEPEIRAAKQAYEEESHAREREQVVGVKRKRCKTLLKDTHGQNFPTFALRYVDRSTPPFALTGKIGNDRVCTK